MSKEIRDIIYATCISIKSICLEVGVHRGINAEKIAKHNPQKLYLIDCWDCQRTNLEEKNIIIHSHAGANNEKQTNWYNEVKEKFQNNTNVEIIKEYSHVACESFENNFFDFIYIDGLHDYSSVLQDLNMWKNKLKTTGIILCDDYTENSKRGYGVIPAIESFLKNNTKFTGQLLGQQLFLLKQQ